MTKEPLIYNGERIASSKWCWKTLTARYKRMKLDQYLILYTKINIQLSAALWTIARQAPLSLGFPRQEYGSGLPFPTPRDLPNPGIEPKSFTSPALAGKFFTISS